MNDKRKRRCKPKHLQYTYISPKPFKFEDSIFNKTVFDYKIFDKCKYLGGLNI